MSDRRAAMRVLLWRRRGAWQWPAFGAALAGETVLLHELPIAGYGTGVVQAFVIAGLINVLALAALAPLGASLVRRRRPDLPRVVARDRAGTVLIAFAAGVLAGLALAHRPAVRAHERAFRRQSDAVRRYVGAAAPAQFGSHVDEADTLELDNELFRTCVPGSGSHRLCLFVDTSTDPATVRIDPSATPNSRYALPG